MSVVPALFMMVLGWNAPHLAQLSGAPPKPKAEVHKASVWPPAVYLGERFVYRVSLRLGASSQLLSRKPRIPRANILGAIETQRRQGRLILKIPMNVTFVRRFGPRVLPSFGLVFRTGSGAKKKLWVPGPKIELRARYASTRSFRLTQDPRLPFVQKKSKLPMPSHEWRVIPLPKGSQSGTSTQWWAGGGVLLLALLTGLFAWFRRRKPTPEAPPPSAYETAKARLAALPRPDLSQREAVRETCHQLVGILRDYLHELLPEPSRHLTAQELERALAPVPTPWAPLLHELFSQTEPLCFGPEPLLESVDSLAALLHHAMDLLEAMERWHRQQAPQETP